MDKELEDIIYDIENQDEMAVSFAIASRAQLKEENRFPEFGTRNDLNCMANYLNPTLKGCHLKMKSIKKIDATKVMLEENLKQWKKEEAVDEMDAEVVDDPEPTTKKLSPTEMLKKQLREEESRPGVGIRISSGSSAVFTEPVTPLQRELQTYQAMLDAGKGTDLLQW